MGRVKKGYLFFAIIILTGISGWATYRILTQGIRDFMLYLSTIRIAGVIDLGFLRNFYIQHILIILGAMFILYLLTGWHFKKLLEEILE